MKKLKYIAAIACASLGLAAQVSAITIGDNRDLGLINKNQPADTASTTTYVNVLLDRPLGSGPTTITTPNGYTNDYTRTNNDPLLGVYPDAVFSAELAFTGGNVNLGSTGYLYLLGKYDGQNYGSVVWYVGGLTGTESIPLTAVNGQYGLSHVYAFNGTGGTTVPDSGSTLMLLGTVLSGLGAARRFIKG
jgi:hypothetical protein